MIEDQMRKDLEELSKITLSYLGHTHAGDTREAAICAGIMLPRGMGKTNAARTTRGVQRTWETEANKTVSRLSPPPPPPPPFLASYDEQEQKRTRQSVTSLISSSSCFVVSLLLLLFCFPPLLALYDGINKNEVSAPRRYAAETAPEGIGLPRESGSDSEEEE
ncbi:hypothetical protein PAMP_009640 [Pampus punctatissimus]